MSVIWRGLGLIVVVSASLAWAQLPSHPAFFPDRAGSIQPEAWQIVQLANQARAQSGASPLKWDAALAAAARQHCLRMAAEGPISHRYQGESGLSERAAQVGAHFSLIEENVAVGPDPATIHQEWMDSAGHRANLLNPDVDRVGVAVVASRGTLYAVADYERTVPVLTQLQIESAVAQLVRVSGLTVLRDNAAARALCATDQGIPDSFSGPKPGFIMRWQGADLTQLPRDLVNRMASGEYRQAAVGSCPPQGDQGAFTAYRLAVLLY
ncbi:MAG: CAP domain-containing protein [Terracidiphilus sp.]